MPEAVTISELLGPKAVLARLEAATKKQALQDIANHAAASLGIEAHRIFDVLWARERLGTTGVGHGIAIPHGRVAGLEKVRGFFARLAVPVDFESVDGGKVDLIFTLLAPESAGADHLHALAAVSRVLRDPKICEKLRAAKDAESIECILTAASTARAA